MMHVIETGSLKLEPQTAAHAEQMFAVLSDPAIYEHENEPPPSLEWLRARFAQLESRPRSHRLRVVQRLLGSRARARGRPGDDLRAGPALSGTPAHRGIQTQESSLDAPARAPGFLAGLARATHEASR